MIASFLPIGLVREDGRDCACPACGRDIVVFLEPDGVWSALDVERESIGTDAGQPYQWDKRGRMDGWMSLRPHVCPKGGSS
jgi:hypothetical protein